MSLRSDILRKRDNIQRKIHFSSKICTDLRLFWSYCVFFPNYAKEVEIYLLNKNKQKFKANKYTYQKEVCSGHPGCPDPGSRGHWLLCNQPRRYLRKIVWRPLEAAPHFWANFLWYPTPRKLIDAQIWPLEDTSDCVTSLEDSQGDSVEAIREVLKFDQN